MIVKVIREPSPIKMIVVELTPQEAKSLMLHLQDTPNPYDGPRGLLLDRLNQELR